MNQVLFNWSGGKDSALALYYLQQQKEYDVLTLLTSVNKQFQRISMHGVRVELLKQQAQAINLPLKILEFPEMPTMDAYNKIMREALVEYQQQGIKLSVFGDIFLEDLRQYREDQLAKADMKGVFPIWKIPTAKLVEEFIDLGFKAVTVCVKDSLLGQEFVGRVIDREFVKDLPKNVDPCGENGEFHSFVYDGPNFLKPVKFEKGEIVFRKYAPNKSDDGDDVCSGDDDVYNSGFWYCDLLAGD